MPDASPVADERTQCHNYSMSLVRFVILASLAIGLPSCGPHSGGERRRRPNVQTAGVDNSSSLLDNDAEMIRADNSSSPLDNIASADSDHVLFLSDLKLVRSAYNDEDSLSGRPPDHLFGTRDFGFFDDITVMRQLSQARLIEMHQFDFGFRFVTDLDHDGQQETYRTGWFRRAGQEPNQFLAVFEDDRLRDVWAADDEFEPLTISWHDRKPIVFPCNCPNYALINYRNGKLHMRWTGE